jgi:hypothetical protein
MSLETSNPATRLVALCDRLQQHDTLPVYRAVLLAGQPRMNRQAFPGFSIALSSIP